jgi:hypothetical protein
MAADDPPPRAKAKGDGLGAAILAVGVFGASWALVGEVGEASMLERMDLLGFVVLMVLFYVCM